MDFKSIEMAYLFNVCSDSFLICSPMAPCGLRDLASYALRPIRMDIADLDVARRRDTHRSLAVGRVRTT